MSDIYIINAAGSPAVLSSSGDDSIFIPEGAREIEVDEFEKIVAEAVATEQKRIEASEAEAAAAYAEKADAANKQAQEAYDSSIAAGLPDIVATGIARNFWPAFDPKTNNGQGGDAPAKKTLTRPKASAKAKK